MIRQGVRQGGILSTLHYKLYNNDLLHLLESLMAGMSIGHIDCSCPTCADDVAPLAKFLVCLQLLPGELRTTRPKTNSAHANSAHIKLGPCQLDPRCKTRPMPTRPKFSFINRQLVPHLRGIEVFNFKIRLFTLA